MKVFVVGIAGGVGIRIADQLLSRGDQVNGFVRQASKREELSHRGILSKVGDLVKMSVGELAVALRGSDVVVFTAGAGGSDDPEAPVHVDGEGPGKLAAAAELAGVRRFFLVSVFPEAGRGGQVSEDFELYVTEKKKAETKLVRTCLDWVILRPSSLTDDPGEGKISLGLAEIHGEITRDDVAATIVEILRQPNVNRMILEVTAGPTPILEAVAAMKT